ncbi:IS1 family transposase, partial [Escherichia coli]
MASVSISCPSCSATDGVKAPPDIS